MQVKKTGFDGLVELPGVKTSAAELCDVIPVFVKDRDTLVACIRDEDASL